MSTNAPQQSDDDNSEEDDDSSEYVEPSELNPSGKCYDIYLYHTHNYFLYYIVLISNLISLCFIAMY